MEMCNFDLEQCDYYFSTILYKERRRIQTANYEVKPHPNLSQKGSDSVGGLCSMHILGSGLLRDPRELHQEQY